MCGRYSIFQEDEDIQAIIAALKQRYSSVRFATGEVFPTNMAPVLVMSEGNVMPELFKWGYKGFKGNNVIINARSETAEEKPMFRRSLYSNRCVIPCNGFFEWNKQREKYLFKLADESITYLAGLYRQYDDTTRYVVLTTAANESMSDTHSRMPVVLLKAKTHDWLSDINLARRILHEVPPMLEKTRAG